MWKVVKTEVSNGHKIEMRKGVFGKGRAQLVKWEIFRDDTWAGYAVNEQDAEQNFARVVSGLVLDRSTGRYVNAQ